MVDNFAMVHRATNHSIEVGLVVVNCMPYTSMHELVFLPIHFKSVTPEQPYSIISEKSYSTTVLRNGVRQYYSRSPYVSMYAYSAYCTILLLPSTPSSQYSEFSVSLSTFRQGQAWSSSKTCHCHEDWASWPVVSTPSPFDRFSELLSLQTLSH